ncbi:hypothetical protein A2769_01505 [Candidatus Daviesbacteria bacterium RIFCSPHIGHO2_01_FULL_37_27]|nr:MAG: hypothetical protein A2769_01505 [Candidatus Daviesbacteria bacterium RIFCSPHIGHO2_01_FULL_37_27]
MTKSITIDNTTAKKIIKDLESFEILKASILNLLPEGVFSYGSKLWWEKETLVGEEEIKKGKYKTYKNTHSLIDDLHKGI